MKKIFLLFLLLISKNSFANMSKINAHQFSFRANNGENINLSDLKNKVILVVNTASKCGLTPQYKELQELYLRYKDKGLVVVAVPSADFGGQEFASNDKVKEFVDEKFKTTFLMTEINKVSGKEAHPFYLWANKEAGFLGSPKWNFHKYLIDKNGNFIAWFASTTSPISSQITKKIEEIL